MRRGRYAARCVHMHGINIVYNSFIISLNSARHWMLWGKEVVRPLPLALPLIDRVPHAVFASACMHSPAGVWC